MVAGDAGMEDTVGGGTEDTDMLTLIMAVTVDMAGTILMSTMRTLAACGSYKERHRPSRKA